MDALDCKSASRCAQCYHFVNSRCELEVELRLFMDHTPRRAKSAIPLTLAWQDTRAPSGVAEA